MAAESETTRSARELLRQEFCEERKVYVASGGNYTHVWGMLHMLGSSFGAVLFVTCVCVCVFCICENGSDETL